MKELEKYQIIQVRKFMQPYLEMEFLYKFFDIYIFNGEYFPLFICCNITIGIYFYILKYLFYK